MKIGAPPACISAGKAWPGFRHRTRRPSTHPTPKVKILSTLSDFTQCTEYFLNLLRLVKQRHLIEQKILHGARPGRRPSHDDPLGSRILF